MMVLEEEVARSLWRFQGEPARTGATRALLFSSGESEPVGLGLGMPWGLCILSLSIFAFIFSMIGMLADYFAGRGRWFLLLLACVVLSSVWMGMELYRFLVPPASVEPTLNLRPVNPL
jgi:hypothetical protein